jgi:hypothetical protein
MGAKGTHPFLMVEQKRDASLLVFGDLSGAGRNRNPETSARSGCPPSNYIPESGFHTPDIASASRVLYAAQRAWPSA